MTMTEPDPAASTLAEIRERQARLGSARQGVGHHLVEHHLCRPLVHRPGHLQ